MLQDYIFLVFVSNTLFYLVSFLFSLIFSVFSLTVLLVFLLDLVSFSAFNYVSSLDSFSLSSLSVPSRNCGQITRTFSDIFIQLTCFFQIELTQEDFELASVFAVIPNQL